jgi:hypothetical protein
MARESLESIWWTYRPSVEEFTRIALLVGWTQQEVDEFLDAPSETQNEKDEE